jgi:predicted enzyme related to lactoylglutathione lyase
MASALTWALIDCEDPERVGRFWADALGWQLAQNDNGTWWASKNGGFDELPGLVFLKVPERKTIKNRVHLDINPVGCDQSEELERLLSLGATKVDIGQGDVAWVVLADPEGNEFCLLNRRLG